MKRTNYEELKHLTYLLEEKREILDDFIKMRMQGELIPGSKVTNIYIEMNKEILELESRIIDVSNKIYGKIQVIPRTEELKLTKLKNKSK